MITRSISENVKLIEDCETQIKLAIKKGYLSNSTTLSKTINKLIDDCVVGLTDDLKEVARKSLLNFAKRILTRLKGNLGVNGLLVGQAVKKALSGRLTATEYATLKLPYAPTRVLGSTYSTMARGVPNQVWSKTYIKAVNGIMQKIADEQSMDASDLSGRNSLRNKAEMAERWRFHQEELVNFSNKGTKLVICSTHADCSLRCYKHQGKVYSLDGTSGTTDDGRKYVPLEFATNQNQVYYTNPRTGTQYKGGLLGYNCRHRLYEYTGQKAPIVTKAEQKKEYSITQKQRNYENQIRKWRERALLLEDKNEQIKAKRKAVALNKEYIAFSIKNERAYYPDRCKVLFPETD